MIRPAIGTPAVRPSRTAAAAPAPAPRSDPSDARARATEAAAHAAEANTSAQGTAGHATHADTAATDAEAPSAGGDAAGPDDFSAAIDEFARAWRRARMRLRHEEGLSIAQYHLLEPLIDAPGPLPVGRLAAHAGIAAPTATRMLDALVRDGLCERGRAAEDRRCVQVSLTPAGRAAAAERRGRMEERRARISAALTAEERRDAARLLQRLADAIEGLRR